MNTKEILLSNQQLRERIADLLPNGVSVYPTDQSISFDLLVTHDEVNRRHGTGVILQNVFQDDSRLISVRARNDYDGEQSFGALSFCLPRTGLSRMQMFEVLVARLCKYTVRRILCVPFYPDSLLAAIAAKEIFGAPLCTYVMDDANVEVHQIPDKLMAELIDKSDLRLAISPEMRQAYENKFRRKIWLLPPVVSANVIARTCTVLAGRGFRKERGVLVGNIWGQDWVDRLIEAVRQSGTEVDWYYNKGASPWVKVSERVLVDAGISLREPLSEPMMASALRDYSFGIVPSGTLEPSDDNRAIARLSLPSKLLFMLATSNIPIIVMGNAETAAARFVSRFGVGVCCDYTGSSLQDAVRSVTDTEKSARFRRRAFEIARHFSSDGVADWVWGSLDAGEPLDMRFEKLMPPEERGFSYYVEPEPPKHVYRDLIEVYRALARVKDLGFKPDFVVDVGASNGIWSHSVRKLFPEARFILVEPLASRYKTQGTHYFADNPNFEIVEAAVSDRADTMTLHLSSNMYSSSFFETGVRAPSESVRVEVVTLDQIAKDNDVSGRGLLKLDVQFAEHLALAGATSFIRQIDAIAMELSLKHVPEGGKVFLEMLNLMNDLDFKYFDDVGEWRAPTNGLLVQKDVLFVRKELFS